VLLEHPNVVNVMGRQGCGNLAHDLEDQANEVAGELLLPMNAAHRLARRQVSDQEAALMYRISREMARWRLNSTGARLAAQRQLDASRRFRGA
jgi:Zn-dependent peptidase ImmA (M78 family)